MRVWTEEIICLAHVAASQPHAAFTKGISSCWSYVLSTILEVHDLFLPFEEAIHQRFIYSSTSWLPFLPSTREIELLAFPIRLRGLRLDNHATSPPCMFQGSELLTSFRPLVALIVSQESYHTVDHRSTSYIKNNIRRSNNLRHIQ